MKPHSTILSVLAGLTLLTHAAVVPVTGITGHDGGNWPTTFGHLTDMVNALNPGWATSDHSTGMNTSANLSNPATWTWSGTYQQTWHANSILSGTPSGKIGWVVMDFGSVVNNLDDACLWASSTGQTDSGKEQVKTYKLWYSSGVGINTLPAMPNSQGKTGDYNFTVGDWQQIGGTHTLGTVHGAVSNVIDLGGISARYIGIEVMTIYGVDTRMAIAQVEVTKTVADNDPPTLAPSGIVDNKGGAPVDVNTKVIYTVSFSEDMAAGSVSAADFSNAGTSSISIGAINEISPGVFTIEVTPTSTGSLRLQVPVSASMTDVAGNPLDNNPAILDDTTLTVNADSTPPTLVSIVDDQGGGSVGVNTIVIYTVTFSEDMNSGTVSAADFSNAGTSAITIGNINEPSSGVFTIVVTPTTEGTLRLQVPTTAIMTDVAGIPLDNDPAIVDDTTITVQLGTPSTLVEIASLTGSHGGDQYANGMVSLTNGSGITKADPGDPSTWTFNGSGYPEEWMATYLKVNGVVTPGLNGKVAWASLDFGSKTPLGMLYLFNTNYSSGVSGADQFNLYYADSPAVALPAQPVKNTYASTGLTPQGDYNFAGGGWTLFNTSGPLNANLSGITSLNLPGVSARYLAIEILSNQGDSNGGGRVGFDEIAVTAASLDSDGDLLPDEYELANTTPPSTTSLDPLIDLEPDGLTTWQEYVLGTDPNDADSDDDTLNDGPETLGAGSRPPTNPLLADTDGDTLSDLAETNTGVWGGSTAPGTDPTNADTDEDGLKDNVETNTGTYASATATGTSPLNANSDGDNAGDWYEVAIIDKDPDLGSPPNNPNSSGLKPNIPYPLTGERGAPAASNAPVKVFIMSGQSNMVGFGQIAGTKPGTLQTITGAENKFPNLVTAGGVWTTRNDVYYRGVISDLGDGPLKADVAGDKIGPELGFGHVMGWYCGEPVLLIKSSIGNRSLMWDFAAPTTPSFDYAVDGRTYAGYGQAPNSWLTATGAPSPFIWYAGKQFDDCFKKESDMSQLVWQAGTAYQEGGNIGSQVRHNGKEYQCTVDHIASAATEPGVVGGDWATVWKVFTVDNAADVLDSFATHYAGAGKPFEGRDFEIAGYVWWQGYGDQGEPAATRYRENMARFITQIRAYYKNRYPTKTQTNAPFVLATFAADGGWNNPGAGAAKVAQAQLDVIGDVPNVKTIEARGFWRDASISPKPEGFHYNWNAETYMLAGDALGRAMVELQGNVQPPAGYAAWSTGPFQGTLSNTSPSLDFDNGGLETGIEWVVGGDPTDGSDDPGLLPTLDNTSDPDFLIFTFIRTDQAAADTNTTIAVEYGSNLGVWTKAVPGPNIIINETNNGATDSVEVKIRRTLAAGGKLFARLNVAVATE